MKRARFTEEQIIAVLKEHEAENISLARFIAGDFGFFTLIQSREGPACEFAPELALGLRFQHEIPPRSFRALRPFQIVKVISNTLKRGLSKDSPVPKLLDGSHVGFNFSFVRWAFRQGCIIPP
jgi:hypothetical protein